MILAENWFSEQNRAEQWKSGMAWCGVGSPFGPHTSLISSGCSCETLVAHAMCEHHATTEGYAGCGFHLSAPLFLGLDLACICSDRWCILWSDRVLGSPHPFLWGSKAAPYTYFHDTALYTCTLRVWGLAGVAGRFSCPAANPRSCNRDWFNLSSKLFIN